MKLRIRALPTAFPKSRHVVYTHRAANGSPLYVGMTQNLEQRTRGHVSTAVWFEAVASIDVLRVASNAKAVRVERALIEELRPPFNRRDNPLREKTKRRKGGHAAAVPRKESSISAAAIESKARAAAEWAELWRRVDEWSERSNRELEVWRELRRSLEPQAMAAARRELREKINPQSIVDKVCADLGIQPRSDLDA